MLCVFFILFFCVSGSASFVDFYRSSFLRVAVWKSFRERTFVLWCRCLSCVFWCCFAYVFVLFFVLSFPKLSWKNSLDVRSGVIGFFFSPSLVFLADVVVLSVFFERDSSGSNRAHPHTHLFRLFPFPCFCPRRACYHPFWPCVPSFSRFVGVPFWAPGVLAFFGFARNIGGLAITRPF